ncbi:gp53-like domain-containing protein [Photorhabdus namnaonensis]|nr:hypothetical protein [Photorhabdus namnaonensis]
MSNGYQYLPGGLILQWGRHKFTPLVENTVILPTPFINGCLSIFMTDTGGATFPMGAAPNGTLNSFNAWVAGKAFIYNGIEYTLSSGSIIVGQYLAIGF